MKVYTEALVIAMLCDAAAAAAAPVLLPTLVCYTERLMLLSVSYLTYSNKTTENCASLLKRGMICLL